MSQPSTLLSKGELLRVLAATPTGKGGTVTLWGQQVPYLPPTVNQVIQHVAKYKSVQAFFSFGAAVGVAAQAVEAGQESPVEPDADAYMAAQIEDGPLADAAFVAIAIGHPGDVEIETALLGVPQEEFEVALETIQNDAWQDDPSDFWGRVGRGMGGRLMRVMQAAVQKKAGTSSSTTTTTAPTSSTATTAPSPTSPAA